MAMPGAQTRNIEWRESKLKLDYFECELVVTCCMFKHVSHYNQLTFKLDWPHPIDVVSRLEAGSDKPFFSEHFVREKKAQDRNYSYRRRTCKSTNLKFLCQIDV